MRKYKRGRQNQNKNGGVSTNELKAKNRNAHKMADKFMAVYQLTTRTIKAADV